MVACKKKSQEELMQPFQKLQLGTFPKRKTKKLATTYFFRVTLIFQPIDWTIFI